MGQSSDQLRQEIDQHRQDAERKINDLQGQVEGTAEDLRARARGTAEDVREQVQGAVESAAHTVSENVDIEQFIQERPLVSLGAALIGGFVIGGMLGDGDGRDSSRGGTYSAEHAGTSAHAGSTGSSLGQSVRKMIRDTGLEDTFNSAAAAMMGTVTDQLKQTMDRNMPGFASKMDEAKHTDGSVKEKSRAVQQ